MALYIGNTLITKLYKGAVEITKLYLGNVLIYSSSLYNAITTAYNTRALADSYTVESLPCVDAITDAFTSTPVAAMIPSGFKTSKFASILPNDGTGDFTVVRNSSKTRVNSSGLVETLGVNVISPDYTDSGCPVLLIEPQSTNLVPYSYDFSKYNGGTKISGYSSPDGGNNAYKISGNSGVTYSYNSSLRTTDTKSIWARTVSGTGQVHLCSYNLNTNSLFTVTEQWQRFEVIGSISSGSNAFWAADFAGSSTLTEVIVWGAQAEDISGADSTSYIPTNGTTATRFSDLVSIDTTSITGTVTSITETINGIDQTPITTIPSTYTIPVGKINKIIIE